MSDKLIKLSDAMDAVMWGNGLDGSVVDDICEKLEALPSADRPAKKWIKHSGDEWVVRVECPNCHRRFQFSPRLMWKCCPLCEIKMNGMVKRKGE